MSEKINMKVYHGTTKSSAQYLLNYGYTPNDSSATVGSQMGQRGILYVTNFPDNAQWYADEKEDGVVIELDVNIDDLGIDPEDHVEDSVIGELEFSKRTGMPATLTLRRPIPKEHIQIYAK